MSKYKIRRWILERLTEKSTWKGLSILAGLLGVVVAPAQIEIIGGAVASIYAAIETLRKET